MAQAFACPLFLRNTLPSQMFPYGDLKKTTEAAETKIPQLESSITALEEEVGQLVAELDKAEKDCEEAKEFVGK